MNKCNYNQRVVLSLLRHYKSLPKADIARQMGLSPTAVGTIISQLEGLGLVLRGEPQRGRVGQPSVPYRISPSGCYSFGLKIGRRTTELVLLNASMEVVDFAKEKYLYPEPNKILNFAETHSKIMLENLPKNYPANVCGLGIAMPSGIWNWRDDKEIPADALEVWRRFDPEKQWISELPWPIFLANDATAACAAELALSRDSNHQNYLYFYIGWFIGGGIVLNGKVYEGSRQNAGAVASMPVFDGKDSSKPLVELASLYPLEREFTLHDNLDSLRWKTDKDWENLGAPLDAWLDQAAHGISQAIAASACVIDFEACIIDGSLPKQIRYELLHKVREKYYQTINLEGLSNIDILAGSVGRNARSIGAACLPLLECFSVDLSETKGLKLQKLNEPLY